MIEKTEVLIKAFRALQTWVSASGTRFVFFVLLLSFVIVVAQHQYLDYLSAEITKTRESRVREANILRKDLAYKVALDTVTLCLESEKRKEKLHTWYCQQAVFQYRQVSKTSPPERINEVIEKEAYAAMRSDISSYLRSTELDRFINSPASKEMELLDLLLSTKILIFWNVALLVIFVLVWWFLWHQPNHKKLKVQGRLVPRNALFHSCHPCGYAALTAPTKSPRKMRNHAGLR